MNHGDYGCSGGIKFTNWYINYLGPRKRSKEYFLAQIQRKKEKDTDKCPPQSLETPKTS